jgi:hypothetical protein
LVEDAGITTAISLKERSDGIEVAADEIGETPVAVEFDHEAADRWDVWITVGGGLGEDGCDDLEELLGCVGLPEEAGQRQNRGRHHGLGRRVARPGKARAQVRRMAAAARRRRFIFCRGSPLLLDS